MISLDTECTGLDLAHGARPFLVTTCDDRGTVRFWEWDVDPLTRVPLIPGEDLVAITDLIAGADLIYLQNAKFDVRVLRTVGVDLPWSKVRDTLVMGHLLGSNLPRDLTSLCATYLGLDIEPLELAVRDATRGARALARRMYPAWKLADEGVEGMPSVQAGSKRDEDKPWKNDMWLPRAVLKYGQELTVPVAWATACSEYANGDSTHTLMLGIEMERLVRERGLWALYEHRLCLPRVACEMEEAGVTVIGQYTDDTIRTYEEDVAEIAVALYDIAADRGHELELAEGAALNDNMRDFFYGSVHQVCPRCDHRKRVKHWNGERPVEGALCPKCAKGGRRKVVVSQPLTTVRRPNLGLPVVGHIKTGNACLDKDVMRDYLSTLDGDALAFVRLLTDKRKRDTDLAYMRAYCRFWVPVAGAPGYFRIHPSLNPCGSDHLRWAGNSPNLQNVGKQEDRCGDCDGTGCASCCGTGLTRLSVRNCFGPAPGREWWSMDYASIEKRIPAYECEEPALIELFEKPDAPPYWGSDHLLLCSLLWPDKFWPLAEERGAFKDRYINEYKRAKNTNFAKQYGAGKRKVDNTALVKGAYELIERGMPRLAQLQAHYLALAERTGFVETLPDRTVDPTRGYPILASRTEDGGVLSTTPFNYHTSGTACWAKNTALVRCSDRLAEWRAGGFDAWLILEIHDELLFDFPRGRTPEEHLPRAVELQRLMEQSGEDLVPRIPTPVSVEYHDVSWAHGRRVG